jgi:hypothetical protein
VDGRDEQPYRDDLGVDQDGVRRAVDLRLLVAELGDRSQRIGLPGRRRGCQRQQRRLPPLNGRSLSPCAASSASIRASLPHSPVTASIPPAVVSDGSAVPICILPRAWPLPAVITIWVALFLGGSSAVTLNHPSREPRSQEPAAAFRRFTRGFGSDWHASEQALKGPKRHQAVSGYWHTTATLADYCRVRSCLVSARGLGIRATDAALAGKPWLPVPVTAWHHRPTPVNQYLLLCPNVTPLGMW